MQIIRVQGQHNTSVSMFRNQTIYLKTVESEQAYGSSWTKQRNGKDHPPAVSEWKQLFLYSVLSYVPVILNNRIQLDMDAQTFLRSR